MGDRKANREPLSRPTLILLATLIIAIFFFLLNQSPWSGFSTRHSEDSYGFRQNPWVFQQKDEGINTLINLPEHMRLEQGKLYTISSHLTYNGAQDETPFGFLHVDHLYCRVLLEGKVLFSCMPEDVDRWDNAKSPGFIYEAFPLPHDCLGKKLEIQLLPTMDSGISYDLPSISFGDYTASIRAAVLRDVPHDVVTVLCILLALTAILFSTFTLSGAEYREGISMGVFSLIFAAYMLTECAINAYYIGNPYHTYLLNYISFSLLPVALMTFIRERLLEKHRKLCNGVIAAEVLFFLAELFLHFTGRADLRELLPIVHGIYFAEMALVAFCVQRMKDKKKKHALLIQITPVIIGMLLDLFIYWNHWEIGGNDATFTILGVIVFLVIELLHVWKSSMSIYTESVRGNVYRQMAFVDELTGAGNRRAFDQEISRIVNGELIYSSIIVASADVNKLKYVNDTFGHAAGDTLIRSSAQIMLEVVGEKGKVFRTGGDEFCIFLYDVDGKEFHHMVDQANRKILSFNSYNKFPISIAVGYDQICDNKILEAVQAADERMYENKMASRMGRDDPVEGVYITKE